MNLDRWDREVAPFLAVICTRTGWIRNDAGQIKEWVDSLNVVPEFETEARDRLNIARKALADALASVDAAIQQYDAKEKVK